MNTVKALIHEPNPIKEHTNKVHDRLMFQIKALEKDMIMMSAGPIDDDRHMKNLIGCAISCPSSSPTTNSIIINRNNEVEGIKEDDYDTTTNTNLENEEEISVLGSCCSDDDDDGDEFFLRAPQAQQQHDGNAFICNNDLKRKRSSAIARYPLFGLESTPLNEIPFECKNTTKFSFLNAKGHSSRENENKMMEFLW